jgi:hypothetical protein
MQQQLNMIDEACRRGREVEATWRVEALQSKLGQSSGPGSLAGTFRRPPQFLLAVRSK